MNLFATALLLFMLAPQDQNLPDAFHKLPGEVSEKATIMVTGNFGLGRGPCIFMADGSRRWPLISSFRITKVYRGQVGGKYIYIHSGVALKSEGARPKLEAGREYLVLLRPSEESLKAIKSGEHVPAWDALDGEEIVAIVQLK